MKNKTISRGTKYRVREYFKHVAMHVVLREYIKFLEILNETLKKERRVKYKKLFLKLSTK